MTRLLTILAAFVLTGCAHRTAQNVIAAQTPGTAAGAGATLTGPANSGQQSTQVAERTLSFQMPRISWPMPKPAVPVLNLAPDASSAAASFALPDPQPLSVHERVETTIGAHQDAAGIVKVAAAALTGWSKIKWLGLLAVVVGIGGLLHAAGNNEGYPLCWWKTIGAGLTMMIVDDSPWLWALLIIPAAFYAVQKIGLMRIP